jgi:hypothetical protein
MVREHATKVCPTHGKKLWYTTSRTQLVCTTRDCDHHEKVDVEIPKQVARAMHQLRKRTRKMMRRDEG